MALSDLDSRIAQLQQEVEAANLARLKALAAKESQEQELKQIWGTLREKFDVSSIEELKALLQTSREGLDTLIHQATESLRDA